MFTLDLFEVKDLDCAWFLRKCVHEAGKRYIWVSIRWNLRVKKCFTSIIEMHKIYVYDVLVILYHKNIIISSRNYFLGYSEHFSYFAVILYVKIRTYGKCLNTFCNNSEIVFTYGFTWNSSRLSKLNNLSPVA